MKQKFNNEEQYLRLPQVMQLTGVGRSSIWEYIQTRGFPKQYAIAPRISVWKKTEIIAWMEEQIAACSNNNMQKDT